MSGATATCASVTGCRDGITSTGNVRGHMKAAKCYKPVIKVQSPTAKEIVMSKGQIRSNKEKKKPKAAKTPATGACR